MINAKVKYATTKAVVKYALATAYAYLDTKELNKLYKEVVHQLDSVLIESTFRRYFDDNQNVVDSKAVIGAAKVLSDVYAATDQIDILKTFGRVFSDEQIQNDYINYINTIKGIADTALPVDVLSRTVSFHRTFSDIVTPVDAIISIFFGGDQKNGVLVDPLGLGDDPEIHINKPFADSYSGFQEQKDISFSKPLYDSVDSPDAFNRLISYIRSYSESVGSFENFNRVVQYDRRTSEFVQGSDDYRNVFGTSFTEPQTNEDEHRFSIATSKQDTQTQSDQKSILSGLNKSDLVSQTDNNNINFGLSKSDFQIQQELTALDLSTFREDITNPIQDEKFVGYEKDLTYQPEYTQAIDFSYIGAELNKSEEQYQQDSIDYTNDYNRQFDDTQLPDDFTTLTLDKYLEIESVILSDFAEVIYYVGRIFNDDQYVDELFSRIIDYVRNYEETVEIVDFRYQETHKTTGDFISSIPDLATLQYYKYSNETQLQQDAGSLITSDYVLNYGEYFSEYYVGEVRTF